MAIGGVRGTKDNSKRRYSGGGPRPDLTAIKRKEAEERQTYWSGLTVQQQLEALDNRLGKGVGAVKQRNRLQAAIEGTKSPKPKKGEKIEKAKV